MLSKQNMNPTTEQKITVSEAARKRGEFLFPAINSCLLLLFFFSFVISGQTTSLKFETNIAKNLISALQNGRLFILLNRKGENEPRLTFDSDVALDAPPILAKDVENFKAGETKIIIDNSTISYPIKNLAELPAGEYFVQALFDTNNDLRSLNAPGNLYSDVQKVNLDAKNGATIKLELSKIVPPEKLPDDTEFVKFIKMQSPLLTKFYGRPIFVRVGIILPRDYEKETSRRYPLLINIGGYGSKFTRAQRLMMQPNFRQSWLADDTPRMIGVYLDGDGPFGDSYQLNSANSGPYGDSLTQELIPYIEKQFRAVGTPASRFLTGGSTGGWVSSALQIFYPDYFNGSWSGFPDPMDFRAYQLVDIYADDNAYVNKNGFDRPSARTANGDTEFTMRLECLKENVLGAGDSYTMSGGQWGAWNAVYSPHGANGKPVPLWDAKTGKINHETAEQWKKYDLRIIVEQNWQTLAPKLDGKLHIWVGEKDDYFLNNGVHLFDDFISQATPSYDGWILYSRTGRHGWMPKTNVEIMKEMMERFEQTSKK